MPVNCLIQTLRSIIFLKVKIPPQGITDYCEFQFNTNLHTHTKHLTDLLRDGNSICTHILVVVCQ